MRLVLNGAAATLAFAIATVAWTPPPASGADPTTPAFFEGAAVSLSANGPALRPTTACSALPTPGADALTGTRLPANDNEPCTDEQIERAIGYLDTYCPGAGWAEVWCHASGSIRVHIYCGPPPDAVIASPPG